MSAEIIQFARPALLLPKILIEQDLREMDRKVRAQLEEPETPEHQEAPALTETGRNSRLRIARRKVWWQAEAATRYWRARMDFESAVESAQNNGVQEGRLHPAVDHNDWLPMVDQYRKALVKQLLTPGWNVASAAWKRTVLERNDYVIGIHVEAELVQRAIDDDLAFLAAHPTKRSIRATKKQDQP